jgi:quercetin 2,3-dioxygenase
MSFVQAWELGFQWATRDPFLFCVHHLDAYPRGDERMGPAASLKGRDIGQDFAGIDGWRMYHGDVVPGFPQHPHRGFETVTLVRRGLIDHSDSLGATARFGAGDVQWLTAGRGIVHSEMFPLTDRNAPNPLELFQIWLNLPRADKMVEPHFAMLWRGDIPVREARDAAGRATVVTLVAGQLDGLRAPPPPPHSWAARPDSALAIWTLRMAPGARFTLPAVGAGVERSLYFFGGGALRVGDRDLAPRHGAALVPEAPIALENGPDEADLLLLQARPIGEPVVQYGPFVMNAPDEIRDAFVDYRRTGFGGWPWPSEGPVHDRAAGRFASRPDGAVERAPAEPGGPGA